MTDSGNIMHNKARYTQALHAMQSGVATEIRYDSKSVEPKHLRTGINAAMSDGAALAGLLIKKGVITEAEYFEAIAVQMEWEKRRYEILLSEHFGKPVTLA